MTEPPSPQDKDSRQRISHANPAGEHRAPSAQAQVGWAQLAPKQAALGAGLGDIN